MGIFSSKKEGGMMDMIRCDEKDFLIWKWRPEGNEVNTTNKENSIRWKSSLRVKDGEVAVFLYKQKDGVMQEFINGPFDKMLETANLPILSSILGAAYGGGTPFQAEIYFINLSQVIEFKATVPFFNIYDFDPNLSRFPIECSVDYQILTKISDYQNFIKIHRLQNLEINELKSKLRPFIERNIKGLTANLPKQNNIPAIAIESMLDTLNIELDGRLKSEIENVFGLATNMINVDTIRINEDEKFFQLKALTTDIIEKRLKTQNIQIDAEVDTFKAQAETNIKNLKDTQRINSENVEESLRIQREQYEKAQSLQTETNNLDLMKLKIQTDAQKTILTAAADSLGEMGTMNLGSGSGGGMNPAGMMTGMMMGGAMGNQMAGMMNQMGNTMNPQNPQTPPNNQMPPPPPVTQYLLSVNGQQAGPFNMQQLQQMVMNGQLVNNTYVWKQGMPNWVEAGQVMELQSLFNSMPPPPPPPPMP
jgi:membrane protease subunit (stomatin/prohibitin family)